MIKKGKDTIVALHCPKFWECPECHRESLLRHVGILERSFQPNELMAFCCS